MKNTYIIQGAELGNKGAQAMIFATISAFASMFPHLEPIVVSAENSPLDIIDKLKGKKEWDISKYRVTFAYGNTPQSTYSILGHPKLSRKQSIHAMIRRKSIAQFEGYYEDAAFVIDINGFAFGDQWGYGNAMRYLDAIEVAKQKHVPIYLMPQSFGPFEFSSNQEQHAVAERAGELLKYPRIIFCREHGGYEAMRKLCPEAHLVEASDLVLQTDHFDLDAIFSVDPSRTMPAIATNKNVGIIPNARNFDHGDKTRIMHVYDSIISELLHMGYDVYLMRHATEDIDACLDIKSLFPDEERVHLLTDDFYCFEYGELFERFNFLIASRFHSIIHAYQRGIPCVVLGWAEKYKELLALYGQEQYAFDVRDGFTDAGPLIEAISHMASESDHLSETIKKRTRKIQSSNVFDAVAQDIRTLQENQR